MKWLWGIFWQTNPYRPLSKSWSIFNAKASVTIPQRYRGYPLQTFDGRIPSEVLLEVGETPPAAPAVSPAGNFCSPSLPAPGAGLESTKIMKSNGLSPLSPLVW